MAHEPFTEKIAKYNATHYLIAMANVPIPAKTAIPSTIFPRK
jgi:hypothetical protein